MLFNSVKYFSIIMAICVQHWSWEALRYEADILDYIILILIACRLHKFNAAFLHSGMVKVTKLLVCHFVSQV